MKKIKLSVILILLTNCLISQTLTFDWYKQNDDADRAEQRYATQDKNFYYTIEIGSTIANFSVFKYDINTLDLIKKQKIEIEQEKKSSVITRWILSLKGTVYLLYVVEYKKLNKKTLFSCAFNEDMKLSKEINKIDSLTYTEEEGDKKNRGDFKVVLSDEAEKILVLRLPPNSPSKEYDFKCIVLDEKLKKNYEKNIKIPYKSDFGNLTSLFRMNNNIMYLLASDLINISDNTEKPKINNILVTHNFNADKTTQIPLKVPDYMCYETKFVFNKNKQLNIIGLISNKEKQKEKSLKIQLSSKVNLKDNEQLIWIMSGAYCMKLNSNNDAIIETQIRNLNEIEENYAYVIKNINNYDDGTYGVVCEQHNVETSWHMDRTGAVAESVYDYTHIYKDIIIFNMGNDPSKNWIKIFDKVQTSFTRNSSLGNEEHSLLAINNGTNLNLIVNSILPAEIGKVANDKYDFGSSDKKCYSKWIKISQTGEVVIKNFSNKDDESIPTIFTNSIKLFLGSNTILLPQLQKDGHYIGKLTLK